MVWLLSIGSVPQIAYVDLEFGDMLGRGGFSGVYKAHLKSRNMDVAVKRVLGRICTQEVGYYCYMT